MPIQGSITSKEQPGAKFTPSRQSVGMTGQTAPIPGMTPAAEPAAPGQQQAPQQREGEQQPGQEGQEGGEQEQQGGQSWRLAAVAKKEQQARARITEAKQAEADAKKALAELEQRRGQVAPTEDQDRTFRRDPEALLRHYGYAPEGVLQFLLNGRQLTPEQRLAADFDERLRQQDKTNEQRLEALRKEQEARAQQEEQQETQESLREEQQRERQAMADTFAEIEDVVKASSAKDFPLVKRAIEKGRGLDAVFEQLQHISDRQHQETGRRPPITGRLYEQAIREVEEAARAELRETVSDPETARALGLNAPAPLPPRRPTTLPGSLRGRGSMQQAPVEQEAPANETADAKRVRVLGLVDKALKAGRIAR